MIAFAPPTDQEKALRQRILVFWELNKKKYLDEFYLTTGFAEKDLSIVINLVQPIDGHVSFPCPVRVVYVMTVQDLGEASKAVMSVFIMEDLV